MTTARAGHAQGTLPDGRVLVADGFDTATTAVEYGRTARQLLPERYAIADVERVTVDTDAIADENSNTDSIGITVAVSDDIQRCDRH